MRAAVFEGAGSIVVRELPEPRCDPDGIVVRVKACGICGSDVRNFRAGLRTGATGQVMGHEIAGVVLEAGPRARAWKPGDEVAIAPDVSCGHCYYCRHGLVNLCVNHRMIGTHWPGGFAELLAVCSEVLEHGMVHRIPAGVSFRHAALAEPLASVLEAQEAAGVGPGSAVAVFGDGPVGCMHVEVAKGRGASPVIHVGRRRLALAAALGADLAIDARQGDPVAAVVARTDGIGVDAAIIATPSAENQEQGIECVRGRGRVILYGGLPRESPFALLDANRIHYREISVIGSFSYPAAAHQRALEAIRDRRVTAERYISRVVPLEGIVEGILSSERGEVLKVMVEPGA